MERKNIRLPEFDYGAGAYFITACSKDRKNIFRRVVPSHAAVGDGLSVPPLTVYGQSVDKWIRAIPGHFSGVHIDKYVVMPNHVHMIVRIDGTDDPSPTLGKVVAWFKYGATKEINEIAKRSALPVFQRSYYDHVIRNTDDYLQIWKYIDENPLKWEMDKYYI